MIFEQFKNDLKEHIEQAIFTDDNDDNNEIIGEKLEHLLKSNENVELKNDSKQIIDAVLRNLLIFKLVPFKDDNDEHMRRIRRLIELTVSFARQNYCTINLPIILISELFDCCTIDECDQLFECLIYQNINQWKDEYFFKNVKNILLRTCNDLLRRLSNNQNMLFCGRILIFLANFFPLFERSGLNLTSEFNNNHDCWSEQSADEDEDDVPSALATENDNEIKEQIDQNFYRNFWKLQTFFRNPIITYQQDNFKLLQNYCNDVLTKFDQIKIDTGSCYYFHALGSNNTGDDEQYFIRYLTNRKLLHLQLCDTNFRRHILIQMLILFQYFQMNIKSRTFDSLNQQLNDEQLQWITNIRIKILQLLEETPSNGKEVRAVIEHLLTRENFWNNWKNEGCNELKAVVNITSEDEAKNDDNDSNAQKRSTTYDYIQSTYQTTQKRRRLGEYLRNNAASNNRILIGNADMNRLWNFCPDNLAACRSSKRVFTPTIEEFFQPIFKLPPEQRQLYCTDSNYCWKSLRLLFEKSSYFFMPTNQVVKPVYDYLESVIERLDNDLNRHNEPVKQAESGQNINDEPNEQIDSNQKINSPSNNNDNDENDSKSNVIDSNDAHNDTTTTTTNDDNKTETEDISDDELLKNVDMNDSVHSNMNDDDDDDGDENSNSNADNDEDPTADDQPANDQNSITETAIDEIAMKLKDTWDRSSPLFGFTDDELEYIKDTIADPLDRMKHLIKIWRDEQGPNDGNLKNLQKIIDKIKLEDN